MTKLSTRTFFTALTGLIMFLGSSAMAQTGDNEVKQTGALMMRKASQLVTQSTCQSLSVAKKLVVAYEGLRDEHSAELPDRSLALGEITDLIARYCVVSRPGSHVVVLTTSTPIVPQGGGGVICSTCAGVPGAEGPAFLPKVISTPQCSRCSEIDALTLAILHMDPEARIRFLQTLPAPVQQEITTVLKSKQTTVTEIVRDISTPSTSITPFGTESPVFVMPSPTQAPNDVFVPSNKGPGIGPRTSGSTILTQPDKP